MALGPICSLLTLCLSFLGGCADWADEVDCRSIRGSQWTGEGCVTIVDEPQTWWDAIADCAQHDSHLISLTTPELQESLQRFLEEDTVYWIGLTYDYWEWSTGRFFFKSFIYTGKYIRPRSFFNVNQLHE